MKNKIQSRGGDYEWYDWESISTTLCQSCGGEKNYPINQQRNIPVFFNSRELLWDNVLQKIEAKKENLKKERIVSIKWWNGKTKLKTYKFGRPI